MTRTLVRQRGARALSGREMRVCVDAGTRWAWQLEDSLAAVYEEQIKAVYDQAAKLLLRIPRTVAAAAPPAGWTIPDPDELGLSLRAQMDDRHARRQAGDDASEAIRVEAVRRVTMAGLQAMGINLSLRNPLVEGVLRDQLGGKIVGIRHTTRQAIMGSLETSWKAGDSIPRAAAKLRESAPEIAASRSRTIARTELLAAVNGGAHALASISNAEGAQDGQPPLLKIWLTAEDERVRDTHVDAGTDYGPGSGIPMDEPFVVGDSELQFPGDPDGSAGEVINCRCAISYEEAFDPAPRDAPDAVADAIDGEPAPPPPAEALPETLAGPSATPGWLSSLVDAAAERAYQDDLIHPGGIGSAVDAYQSTDYARINAVLRHDLHETELDPEERQTLSRMRDAFAGGRTEALPQDAVLYRAGSVASDLPVEGTVVTDPAFLSTTINPDEVARFGRDESRPGREKVALRIHAPEGTRFLVPTESTEGEVILGPGTSYRIIGESAERIGDLRTLDAEIIRPAEAEARAEGASAKEYEAASRVQDELRDSGENRAGFDALRRYMGSSYGPMNNLLRGTLDPSFGPEVAADAQKQVDALTTLFKDAPALDQDTTLWRAFSIPEGADVTGETLVDPAFASTSLQRSIAERGAATGEARGREKAILRVRAPAGSRFLVADRSESELLFPPNSGFRIVREREPTVIGDRTVRTFDAELRPPAPEARGDLAARPAASGNTVLVDRAAANWDADRLRAMFDSKALADNDLTAKVSSYDRSTVRSSIQVNAIITDRDGNVAADIDRRVNLTEKTVEHSSFFIEPQWQGKGIAKDLLRSSIREYDRAGIERVEVTAAGKNGRYTWARFGFDFESARDREGMRAAFRNNLFSRFYDKLPKTGIVDGQTVTLGPEAQLRAAFPETMARIDAAEHSWEFAGMSLDEAGVVEADFGKQAMLSGPGWGGVLDLAPSSESRRVFDEYVGDRVIGKPTLVEDAPAAVAPAALTQSAVYDAWSERVSSLSRYASGRDYRKALRETLAENGVTLADKDSLQYATGEARNGVSGYALRDQGLDEFRDATSLFPKEWVEASNAGEQPLSVATYGRDIRAGYIDKDALLRLDDNDGTEVMAHELAHRMETAIPGLVDAERAWLQSRLSADEIAAGPKQLMKQAKGEVGFKDKLAIPYVGRIYEEEHMEVLSMGIQALAGEPGKAWDALRADKDFMSFVLNALSTFRP